MNVFLEAERNAATFEKSKELYAGLVQVLANEDLFASVIAQMHMLASILSFMVKEGRRPEMMLDLFEFINMSLDRCMARNASAKVERPH